MSDQLYLQYFKEEADRILLATDIQNKSATTFVKLIKGLENGVLGTSIKEFGPETVVGSKPSPSCVIVDPCSLYQKDSEPNGPNLAYGVSEGIYRYIGIENDQHFPLLVASNLLKDGDVKYHFYQNQFHVIHCKQPKLTDTKYSSKKVIEILGSAYANIFQEFIQSNQPSLRVSPLSLRPRAKYSVHDLASFTWKSMMLAFNSLSEHQQSRLLQSQIYLCIYNQADVVHFKSAGFTFEQETSANNGSLFRNLDIHSTPDEIRAREARGLNKPIRVKVKTGQSAEQIARFLTKKHNLPADQIHMLEKNIKQCILQAKALDERSIEDQSNQDCEPWNLFDAITKMSPPVNQVSSAKRYSSIASSAKLKHTDLSKSLKEFKKLYPEEIVTVGNENRIDEEDLGILDEDMWSWLFSSNKIELPVTSTVPDKAARINLSLESDQWSDAELKNLPTPSQLSSFLVGLDTSPSQKYLVSPPSFTTTPYLKTLATSLEQKRTHRPPDTASSQSAIPHPVNISYPVETELLPSEIPQVSSEGTKKTFKLRTWRKPKLW